eukprot:scaffold98808_cov69-Phaeocystis_antarctica.AAC.1
MLELHIEIANTHQGTTIFGRRHLRSLRLPPRTLQRAAPGGRPPPSRRTTAAPGESGVAGVAAAQGCRFWPPRRAAPSQVEAWAPAWLSVAPLASAEQSSPRGGYSAGPLPLASFFGRLLRAAAAAAAAAVYGTREAAGVAASARKARQCTGT